MKSMNLLEGEIPVKTVKTGRVVNSVSKYYTRVVHLVEFEYSGKYGILIEKTDHHWSKNIRKKYKTKKAAEKAYAHLTRKVPPVSRYAGEKGGW